MYQIKVFDEFIYNRNRDIALKLTSKSVFAGENVSASAKYPYFEVWLLQSPHCAFATTKSNYEVSEGDVLVFSRADSTEIIGADSNAVFLCLQIDASAFCEMLPSCPVFDERSFFSKYSKNFKNVIPANSPVAKVLKEELLRIAEVFTVKRPGYEMEILQYSAALLLTIARDTNYHTNSEIMVHVDSYSKNHKALKKAIDYIDSHLNEELTLERISAVAELSPNYFSNIFREQTGVKLWDYIGEKRIILATQLLIEYPNDSIISIALKCGFNNCPNFNRAFKKYTGQTPKKYKTSILRQENTI